MSRIRIAGKEREKYSNAPEAKPEPPKPEPKKAVPKPNLVIKGLEEQTKLLKAISEKLDKPPVVVEQAEAPFIPIQPPIKEDEPQPLRNFRVSNIVRDEDGNIAEFDLNEY